MVKRSLIVSLTFFVAYNLFLFLFSDSKKYYPQNITQDNSIKVQEYIFNDNLPEKVIVGSSLAAKLNQDIMKNSFYNLAFRGQSVYDGFEIILSRKEMPSNILVEYNKILRSPQKTIVDRNSLKYQLGYEIKKNVLSQREKNQPVNMLILLAYNMFDLMQTKDINSSEINYTDKIVKEENIKTNGSMENVIKIELNSYNEIPPNNVINDKIKLLKKYISIFEEKGTSITFFEMPIDPKLCSMKLSEFIRKTIRENFPPDIYNYVEPDDCSNYLTKDGIHLVDKSAERFTFYLMNYKPE